MNQFYGDTSTLDIAMRCRSDEQHRLFNLFNGKSVCLVGNGKSALLHDGNSVDGHDLVVRMNEFKLHDHEKFIGHRTDVHAFTGSKSVHSLDTWDTIQHYYCADGFIEKKYLQPWMGDENLLFWTRPKGQWEDFLDGAWPTTGLRILLDALNSGARSVTLLGYDFYEGGHTSKVHSPAAEKRYITFLANSDKRVKWESVP